MAVPGAEPARALGWAYIFQASGWPAIRIMLAWTAASIIAFLVWARFEHAWPFGPKEIHEDFAVAPAGPGSPTSQESRLFLYPPAAVAVSRMRAGSR